MRTASFFDLRQRVVSAEPAGATCRQAVALFGVSRVSVSRWSQKKRGAGHDAAKPPGGDRDSRRIEAQADLVRRIDRPSPQSGVPALRGTLRVRGLAVKTGSLSRSVSWHRMTRRRGAARSRTGTRGRRLQTAIGAAQNSFERDARGATVHRGRSWDDLSVLNAL